MFHLFNFHVPCCRFKDHVQSNHPKHFLSEEEFVKLRVELSKSSLAGMISEDDAAVAQEELPPGTEDLADPAKVKLNDRSCRGDTFFSTYCWLGLAGSCLFAVETKALVRFEAVSLCQQPSPWLSGGLELASGQGVDPNLTGATVANYPRTGTQRLKCRVHTYLQPLQASCSWQTNGDVNPWLQD